MRLHALLDIADLGLTLLAGEEQVDNDFTRVLTATLRDPRRYLYGGELVLSSMQWLQGQADADAFIGGLSEAGVVALGAGTAEVGGPVPDYVVNACRTHRLPLFEVPVTVSFATISERAILGLAAERAGSGATGQALDRHRRLVNAVAGGGGLPSLVDAGAAELGADCWVLTSTGRVVAGTGPLADATALARRFLLADRLPLLVSGPGGPVSLLPAASKAGHRVASWFLVVSGDHRSWERDRHEVATEFATLVGVERSRLDDAKRIENRAAEPLLRLALSEHGTQAEVDSRLAAAEFGPAEPIAALSVRVRGGGPGLAPVIAEELVAPFRSAALVGVVDGEAFGLLTGCAPGEEDMLAAAVRDAVGVIEPALGSAGLAVGISHAPDSGGLRAAVQEARQARRLAEVSEARAKVVAGDEVASHLLLLAAVPGELRRSFRARVLGPLLAYDEEHRSELVRTLRVFLDNSGSWAQTAAELHVHVNTLRYRIGKIGELTGRDLTRFPDRVDLYLALDQP